MLVLVTIADGLADSRKEWVNSLEALVLSALAESLGDHEYRLRQCDSDELGAILRANTPNRALAAARAAMDAHPSNYAVGLVGLTGWGGQYSFAIIDGEGRIGRTQGPSLSDAAAQRPIDELLRRFVNPETRDDYAPEALRA